jgi:hypothetical protein
LGDRRNDPRGKGLNRLAVPVPLWGLARAWHRNAPGRTAAWQPRRTIAHRRSILHVATPCGRGPDLEAKPSQRAGQPLFIIAIEKSTLPPPVDFVITQVTMVVLFLVSFAGVQRCSERFLNTAICAF